MRPRLRHPRSDGTTHLLFDPVEFLERLAVLVPRPRIDLVLYHGVLAPRAGWRQLVIHFGNGGVSDGHSSGPPVSRMLERECPPNPGDSKPQKQAESVTP